MGGSAHVSEDEDRRHVVLCLTDNIIWLIVIKKKKKNEWKYAKMTFDFLIMGGAVMLTRGFFYWVGDSVLASCESERGCCCLWVLSKKLPNVMCLVLTLSSFLGYSYIAVWIVRKLRELLGLKIWVTFFFFFAVVRFQKVGVAPNFQNKAGMAYDSWVCV